jgi:hypothetical protein
MQYRIIVFLLNQNIEKIGNATIVEGNVASYCNQKNEKIEASEI